MPFGPPFCQFTKHRVAYVFDATLHHRNLPMTHLNSLLVLPACTSPSVDMPAGTAATAKSAGRSVTLARCGVASSRTGVRRPMDCVCMSHRQTHRLTPSHQSSAIEQSGATSGTGHSFFIRQTMGSCLRAAGTESTHVTHVTPLHDARSGWLLLGSTYQCSTCFMRSLPHPP